MVLYFVLIVGAGPLRSLGRTLFEFWELSRLGKLLSSSWLPFHGTYLQIKPSYIRCLVERTFCFASFSSRPGIKEPS
ncbi:hypothetical protein BDV33DRAFT_165565 [Aspergillus novoparasiticus]|uniref:Uncharacterized protein n=1 Tax=Aspergillus novoparasiticus TaxID=986946 RepID=A0A5N6F421_9EURO|nr:hypothetical protein BDV33DRAFT_165565 [Aspergillus novoparasiticus]